MRLLSIALVLFATLPAVVRAQGVFATVNAGAQSASHTFTQEVTAPLFLTSTAVDYPVENGLVFDLGGDRKSEMGIRNSRAVELWEVLILQRVSRVGKRKGVASASMEGLPKVDDLPPHFPSSSCLILSDLPVEGRLESVLYG